MRMTKRQFRAAARKINNHWIQGTYYTRDGDRCAIGALDYITAKDRTYASGNLGFPDACDPLGDGVEKRSIRGALIKFNDSPSTTKEDVQTLLLLLGEMADTEQRT